MCTPAPSCKALLTEATRLWPKRSTASDGICSSAQHRRQNRNSDHDRGEAVDLTHDPANGVDCHALAESLRRRKDPRIKYVIWDRRMFSSYPSGGHAAWAWRPYSGTNPHTKHMHVSIRSEHRGSTGPWLDLNTPEARMALINYAAGQKAVGIAIRPQGDGYWILASDGGVFSFGAAKYHGNPITAKPKPAAAFEPWPDGDGYVVLAEDGAVYAFGSARYLGGAN